MKTKQETQQLSRFILASTAIWLVLHAVNVTLVYNLEPTRYPFAADESIFRYWDAAHYTTLTVHGYFSTLWAYYPLYPLLVRLFAPIIGLKSRPDIAGAILSTGFFLWFCVLQSRLSQKQDETLKWLAPATAGGWICFLFSPSSFIFHTNHTESLFLILSFAAFLTARRGRWQTAALIAGLCALTRHQGIIVAIAVAIHATLQRKDWPNRLKVFAGSGAISFALFALYPLYQYYETGSPLTFLRIRSNWRTVNSFYQWIGTLWYANPWQVANWRDNLHLLFFFLLCGSAVYLAKKKEYPLAVYTFLSTITVLFQGETVDMFRFGSVVFPALFLMGDVVMQLPRPLRWAILAGVVWFNLRYTRFYALGEWAY
jgi:Gpi18-like mannosyltransferase